MKRDILLIGCAFIAIGLVSWTFWGNPPMSAGTRLPIAQSLGQDPNLKLVSGQSPYMRDER